MRAILGSSFVGMTMLALTALIGASSPTEAREYPWCVFYDSSTYNCGFTSYNQCQQTAFGNGGFCRPNPFAETRGQSRRRR